MLPRIVQIVNINSYNIACKWNTGETLVINFKDFLGNAPVLFEKIKTPEIFQSVQLDNISKTLYWEGLAKAKDYDGKEIVAPLDFCPDTLYENSKPYHV